MKSSVDIEIRIDPTCHDPKILICTDRITQEIENIIQAIETCTDSEYPPIIGYRDSEMELLSQRDMICVFVEARKVMIRTEKGMYEARKPLSHLEMLLNPRRFIRISRFEIVNLRKIASFDFSITGTVHIRFDDGSMTWVARRYVRAIQQALSKMSGSSGDQ